MPQKPVARITALCQGKTITAKYCFRQSRHFQYACRRVSQILFVLHVYACHYLEFEFMALCRI
jgi:hypothetical protein